MSSIPLFESMELVPEPCSFVALFCFFLIPASIVEAAAVIPNGIPNS